MSDMTPIRIRGGGGSKKGGGTDENTLRSKARARMVWGLSEGVVAGLIDGARSIYFNQTPLQNADGTFNFKNVIWQEHKGLADEGYFNGHDAVETPVSVEVEVKYATGPVQRTIADANVDALRCIIRLPALVEQDADSGELRKTSVQYAIDVRPAGGSWTEAVNKLIRNEKTLSAYQIAHRVPLPAGGAPWDVRVRRITADATDEKLQNQTWWESYVELVEGKFLYPHTAKIALEVNAEDMGSSIPPISFHLKGIKLQVPSNYDPVTRVYTGIWDGTFKIAWSNNPAWIFYDLITSERYGLGEFVDASLVDKWSLYAIAQYCDQLVDDGYGGTEPRFTYNCTINTQDDAFAVLQQITAAWRGMAFWSLGQVFATADKPTDPSYIVSPANTIGHFAYSGTSLKARPSVVIVTWNDPNDFYRPATEVVISETMLGKFGWREKSLQLTGCTSRSMAHRYGKWVLDSAEHETEAVEWQAGLDQIECRPGDVVAIADPATAGTRIGGRIVSHVGDEIVLDRPFEPTVSESYSLMLVMPNGDVVTRAIASFDGATVTIATAYPDTALVDAGFAITGTDVTPRQFRVLYLEEQDKGIFKLSGIQHDPNKYARIEQGIAFDPLPYTRRDNVSYAPTDLSVEETGYTLAGQTHTTLVLSWTPSPNSLAIRYEVSVDTPNDGLVQMGSTTQTSIDLRDIEEGDYTFHVIAVGYGGVRSGDASITHSAVGSTGLPMATVTALRLSDRPASTTFVGRDVHLAWTNNFPSSITDGTTGVTPSSGASPLYSYNTVKIYVGPALLRSERVIGETFDYPFETNLADALAAGLTGQQRTLTVKVSVTDVYGRTSTQATQTFTNDAPAAPSVTIVTVGQTARISWPMSSDLDIQGAKVWVETTSGFDPETTTPKFDGPGTSFSYTGDAEQTLYVRVGLYDAFSSSGLSVSTIQTVDLGSFSAELSGEFAEVPSYLFGTDEGSLYDKFIEIETKLADLAAIAVSNGAVGHVRRTEIVAELTSTKAVFLEQITVVADDVSALSTRLTALEASAADGTIVAGVVADLAALADEVSAQATALTEVATQVDDVTAGALWRMDAVVAPSGITARFSMMVRVTDADTYIDSGLLIDILNPSPGVYTSRVAIKTDQFVVTDGTNSANALSFEAGVLKLNIARLGRVESSDGVSYLDLSATPALHLESGT